MILKNYVQRKGYYMKEKFRKKSYNFKNNIILILLILGGIFNDFALRALTVGGAFYWKPIVASIAMIIFISIIALFLSYKNRNYVYGILSIVFSLISGMNYLYYQHYNSFLSFSLVNQLTQVKEMGDAIAKTLDFKVLIFAIPPITLIYTIRKLNKIGFFEKIESTRKKTEIVRPLVIGTALLTLVYTTLTSTDLSRLVKQWNRPYIVEQLGIYSFTTADLFKNISSQKLPTFEEDEIVTVLEDLIDENLDQQTENQYTNIFKGRDVYVIHYESAQTFAMDLEFQDGPVTPFLNQMAQEGLFFNNFYPQHSVGTSSDSEFTFSTSLLPINNGTVFMTHANRDYETIQKLLKREGYYVFSMHGNNGDFWNRNIMHNTLGYDRFFSKSDYIIDEEIGLGLSDKSFFRQSIEKIKEIKEEEDRPIMAKLITLTHHYPFDDVEKYGEFDVGHLEGTDIGNYLKSYHYADQALESFIEGLDEEGLLENAVVVLYGDHHAKISKADYEKLYNYNEEIDGYYSKDDEEYVAIEGAFQRQLRRTPLIIWSKDQLVNGVVDTPTGMVDVLPTLGNMLGIFNPYQLGNDIMTVENNTVIFPDGSWIDDKSYYSASSTTLYDLATNEEEIVEEPDLIAESQLAEDKIQLSNNIIQSNLIKTFNVLIAKNKVKRPIEITPTEIEAM